MPYMKSLMLGASLLAALPALAQMAAQTAPPAAVPPAALTGALPGNTIGTRSSQPQSSQAGNIIPADTSSPIAATAPEPAVGADAGVSALLASANQALASNQTGTADEALEQAETEILQRSVPQTQTDYTSQDPVVAQIAQARQAIGNHNSAGATQIINQILAGAAPELSD